MIRRHQNELFFFMGSLWGLYDLLIVIVIIFTKIKATIGCSRSVGPRKRARRKFIEAGEEVGCPPNPSVWRAKGAQVKTDRRIA
jgi:hypothetical protein